MNLLKKINASVKTVIVCMALAITPTVFAAEPSVQASAPLEKIDINLADAATIAEVMDGVGMTKALEIVAHREQNGKFQSLEQLVEVKGIGLATIERNRERILVVSD